MYKPTAEAEEIIDNFKYRRSRYSHDSNERKVQKTELKHLALKYFMEQPAIFGPVSASLEVLDPLMQRRAMAFMRSCEISYGFEVMITATRYSDALQADLYMRGRGNCKRAQLVGEPTSLHSKGLAFTFVPLVAGEVIEWGNGNMWRAAGYAAAKVGLTWAGNYRWAEKDKVELQFL